MCHLLQIHDLSSCSRRRRLSPSTLSYGRNHRNTNKHFGMKMETHTVYDYAVPFRNQTPGSITIDYSWRLWQVKKSWIIKPQVLCTFVTVWIDCLILYHCFFSLNKAKDDRDKAKLSLKGLKAQKKRRPQDTSGGFKQSLQGRLLFDYLLD